MYKQYKIIFITVLIAMIIFITVSIFSDQLSQNLDKKSYEKFLQGNAFYTPVIDGLPWEINVVYNEVHKLSPKNNLILIGASTTREGVLPDQINLPNNWTLHNFAIGAYTIYSFKIMKNYLNAYANHKPDKSDVVVVHIFYASFIEQPPEGDYLKKIIEKTGTYHVDYSGNVTGEMIYPHMIWELENYKIYYLFSNIVGVGEESLRAQVFSSVKPFIQKTDLNNTDMKSNNKCLNISNCDEKLNEYRHFWTTYTRNTTYPGNSTTEFKDLLLQLNNETNVVVVNMYMPSWQRSYPKEQEYERWVESDLISFLNSNDIPWIDYSTSIPDSNFGDSAHLFRQGREQYTELFNNDISKILANISNKIK